MIASLLYALLGIFSSAPNIKEICESKDEGIQNFVAGLNRRLGSTSCEDKMHLFFQLGESTLSQSDDQAGEILDLSPLASHGRLRKLIIYGKYRIRNLDALAAHKNLEMLYINEVESVEPYSNTGFTLAPTIKELLLNNAGNVSATIIGHITNSAFLASLAISVSEAMSSLPAGMSLESLSLSGKPANINPVLRGTLPGSSAKQLKINCGDDKETALDLSSLIGTKIEELWLSSCPLLNTDSIKLLAQLKKFYWTGSEMLSLDSFEGLTGLEILGLTGSKYLKDLNGIAGLTNLKVLSVGETAIEDESLKALSGLINLTSLNLCNTKIKGFGLKYLAPLTKITRLDLDETDIGDEGLTYFKTWPSSSALQHLRLFRNTGAPLTGKTLDSLAHIQSIEELQICYNKIDDAGLDILVQSLPNLTWLAIRGNEYTDEGLKVLRGLKRLNSLMLDDNKHITRQGVETLAELPNLKISAPAQTRPNADL